MSIFYNFWKIFKASHVYQYHLRFLIFDSYAWFRFRMTNILNFNTRKQYFLHRGTHWTLKTLYKNHHRKNCWINPPKFMPNTLLFHQREKKSQKLREQVWGTIEWLAMCHSVMQLLFMQLPESIHAFMKSKSLHFISNLF